ncbi:hypothetical protein V6N13_034836 [Hibiscus sabdariffa]
MPATASYGADRFTTSAPLSDRTFQAEHLFLVYITKRDVYLQQQQDGTIGFYAGSSISGHFVALKSPGHPMVEAVEALKDGVSYRLGLRGGAADFTLANPLLRPARCEWV